MSAAPSSTCSSSSSSADASSKDYYFDSYSHFGIHEEMLKDEIRTTSYMNAIMKNKPLFKDKIVLDVGCGTGILCMFAAKAGAKKVIGVECAEIYNQAQDIVKANGFEHVITLIKGKLEEISLPDGIEKVDIIISEWMGYFLLYESMLDTVLYARDKWLNADGLILPDKASIWIAAIEDSEYREDKINFWDNVYGFNMSPVKELALLEPLVDTCDPKQLLSNSVSLIDIDIYSCTKESLDFQSKFELTFARDDYLHALVSWFDIEFAKLTQKIRFSTGPRSRYTHWKQTVFYLDKPLVVSAGEKLVGEISVKRNAKNPRDLDIELSYTLNGKQPVTVKNRPYRLR